MHTHNLYSSSPLEEALQDELLDLCNLEPIKRVYRQGPRC